MSLLTHVKSEFYIGIWRPHRDSNPAPRLTIPSASIGLCTLNDTDLLVKTVRGSNQATACTVAKAKHAKANAFRQSDLDQDTAD